MEELIYSDSMQYIIQYWYLVMFLIMLLEGPMITFTCAVIASSFWYFNIIIIIILWVFWDIAWDIIYYRIWRWSHNIKLINKFSENQVVQNLSKVIHKRPLLWMIISKFTPHAQPICLTFIWFSKFSFKDFVFYSSILSLPSSIFFWTMWYFFWYSLYEYYKETENFLIVILLIVLILWITVLIYKLVSWSLVKRVVEEVEKEE